jgi:serine/threonine protein kinase
MINTESKKIKLIDFGSCMPLQIEPVNVFYGTQKFSSPEALETKSYRLEDQEVWALGTLLYVLLFKMDPFINDEEIINFDIKKRIRKLRTGSPSISPIPISDNAYDLIIALMQKDPVNRPNLLAIRQFDFFVLK